MELPNLSNKLVNDLQRSFLEQLANTKNTLPEDTPVILGGAGALYHGYEADNEVKRTTQDIDLVIHSGDPKAGVLQKFDKALEQVNKSGKIAVEEEKSPQFPGQMGEYFISKTYSPEEQRAVLGEKASDKPVHVSCEMSVEIADFMVTPSTDRKSATISSAGGNTNTIDIQPYNDKALMASKIGRTMMPGEMKATDIVDIYNMQKSSPPRSEDVREMRMIAANRLSHATQNMKEGMGHLHLEPTKANIAALTKALDGKTMRPIDENKAKEMLSCVHDMAQRVVPDVTKSAEAQSQTFSTDEVNVFKKAMALPEQGGRPDYVHLRGATYPDVVAKHPGMVNKKKPSKEALGEMLKGANLSGLGEIKTAERDSNNRADIPNIPKVEKNGRVR